MRTKVIDLLEELANVGYNGISYVGVANYQSRENEARRNLGNTHDKLYKKALELDELNSELLKELQKVKLDIDLGTIRVSKTSPIYRGIEEVIKKAES